MKSSFFKFADYSGHKVVNSKRRQNFADNYACFSQLVYFDNFDLHMTAG